MAFCEFCKADGQKTGSCAYCGTVSYTTVVTFIYGPEVKDACNGEIRLTNKYLIVRSVSNGELLGGATAGAAFGLIGVLAAGAIDAARKKNYAFYDLQDVQKVIYPYHTKSLKKDTAFKFVNKDGSDFILLFNQNGLFGGKAAKDFVNILVHNGIYVEDGTETTYPVCCMKPFVNKQTFGVRVSPSAATFVKMNDQQFVAGDMGAAVNVGQPTYAPPVPQPVPQPVQQPVPQPVPQPAQRPVPQQPVNPVMCHTCGAMNKAGAQFCCKCGTALQQASVPSADAWKSQW